MVLHARTRSRVLGWGAGLLLGVLTASVQAGESGELESCASWSFYPQVREAFWTDGLDGDAQFLDVEAQIWDATVFEFDRSGVVVSFETELGDPITLRAESCE